MSEGKGRQVNIGRASTMVSCLPFLSLGIQVVREAKAADVLETQRHKAQSASANGVGLPPFRLTPQGVDGHASRVGFLEKGGGQHDKQRMV
jgi:hypothetical protein